MYNVYRVINPQTKFTIVRELNVGGFPKNHCDKSLFFVA